MNGTNIVIVVILILVFIIIFSRSARESYGTPLGQLAPYKEQLNECLNQCNREDPSKRFLKSGNWNCGKYCEFIVTQMAQIGLPPNKVTFNNSFKGCQKQCDIPGYSKGEKKKCISMCFGRNEIAKWCKELWCPYSTIDSNKCMKECILTNNTNNNQVSWSWTGFHF